MQLNKALEIPKKIITLAENEGWSEEELAKAVNLLHSQLNNQSSFISSDRLVEMIYPSERSLLRTSKSKSSVYNRDSLTKNADIWWSSTFPSAFEYWLSLSSNSSREKSFSLSFLMTVSKISASCCCSMIYTSFQSPVSTRREEILQGGDLMNQTQEIFWKKHLTWHCWKISSLLSRIESIRKNHAKLFV